MAKIPPRRFFRDSQDIFRDSVRQASEHSERKAALWPILESIGDVTDTRPATPGELRRFSEQRRDDMVDAVNYMVQGSHVPNPDDVSQMTMEQVRSAQRNLVLGTTYGLTVPAIMRMAEALDRRAQQLIEMDMNHPLDISRGNAGAPVISSIFPQAPAEQVRDSHRQMLGDIFRSVENQQFMADYGQMESRVIAQVSQTLQMDFDRMTVEDSPFGGSDPKLLEIPESEWGELVTKKDGVHVRQSSQVETQKNVAKGSRSFLLSLEFDVDDNVLQHPHKLAATVGELTEKFIEYILRQQKVLPPIKKVEMELPEIGMRKISKEESNGTE